MEKRSEVVLFGTWASTFCLRVALALKVKGIPFEYIEEDLKNKSELLHKYNPVHKKVPVLVHKGKPISESLIIIEYIDEFWDTNPKLFPEDPYERAKVRFWVNFYDQKLLPSIKPIIKSSVEERGKAIDDFRELLKVFEEGIKRDFPGKSSSPFYDGDGGSLNYLGVVLGSASLYYEAFEQALGVVLLDPNKQTSSPVFYSWMDELKAHPLVKETLPSHDKLVARMRKMLNESAQV